MDSAVINNLIEYHISRRQLAVIAQSCQNRSFAEQIDLIQAYQGDIGLLKKMDVDPKNGLSTSQLSSRKQAFGDNQKPVIQISGYCQLLWQALDDFFLRVLVIASLVSLILQMSVSTPEQRKTAWIQSVAILIAVAVVINVTAINNYKKQRQFQTLNQVADARKQVTLRRDGCILNLHQDKLLVGDIVTLTQGMEIPADGMVIQANQLMCDQSAMTGQADPIQKCVFNNCRDKRDQIIEEGGRDTSGRHDVPSCVVLSGTRTLGGEGKMIVLVVGDESCIGKIRSILLQEDPQQTPLQLKLQIIATDIGKFGLISGLLVFIIMFARLIAQVIIQGKWDHSHRWIQLIHHFILALAVVVVAIPEGLPLSVTLSLAFSVIKMLDDNNLVRRMEACQTMGGANNICSDKTGTLTTNKMTLTTMWNVTSIDFNLNQDKIILSDIFSAKYHQLFVSSLAVNSSAILQPVEKGSSTEIAFLKFLKKSGFDYQQLRQKHRTILKFPFSSARKRMSTISQFDGHTILFCKGASQMVLKCCSHWHNKDDKIQPISSEMLKTIQKNIFIMAQRALRTLAIAYKVLTPTANPHSKDSLGVFDIQKQDLCLLGILGVRDVPRPQVTKAIKECKTANIKVRMVTGDNMTTARAIAKQIGIIQPGNSNSIVMQGPQFVSSIGGLVCSKCMTQKCDCPKDPVTAKRQQKAQRIDTVHDKEQFNRIVEHLDVLARSRPQDKYALVTGLTQRGDVVAVTGDGTNDAPALKKADVGFAMGIAGTQVARQASAIILIDDNFNSIVRAVAWGRNIYDSIRKFIMFQLTVNVAAVTLSIIGSAVYKQQILTAIQMLWINLIMDTFASLALATQPPSQQQLLRKPHNRDDYIINKIMFKHIIGQAVYQILVICIIVFAGPYFIPQTADIDKDKDYREFFPTQNETFFPRFRNQDISTGNLNFGNFRSASGKLTTYGIINENQDLYSRHYTVVFNTFVWMQVFNFLNSRKLYDQYNIFGGISKNPLFFIIVGIIAVVQSIIICFSQNFMKIYPRFGLSGYQWLICFGFGAFTLVVSLFLKLLPIGKDIISHQQEIHPKRNKEIRQSMMLSSGRQIHRIQSIVNS